MKIFKKISSSLLITAALVLGLVTVVAPVAYAIDPTTEVTNGINAAGGGSTTSADLPKLIKNIINVLLFVIGAVAVIMIILGGIRYVTSNGDQADVKAAKDTILYAVVGLIVAVLAYAIVQFVVSNLK